MAKRREIPNKYKLHEKVSVDFNGAGCIDYAEIAAIRVYPDPITKIPIPNIRYDLMVRYPLPTNKGEKPSYVFTLIENVSQDFVLPFKAKA